MGHSMRLQKTGLHGILLAPDAANNPGPWEAADPNVVRDKFGHTALHFAAKSGNGGLLRTLLELRAKIWATDARGRTALAGSLPP